MNFQHQNDFIKNFNFEYEEEDMLRTNFENLSINENVLSSDTLSQILFINLPVNGKQLTNFLQNYYDLSKLQRKTKTSISYEDDACLAYLLINANENPRDSLYYKVDTFFILLDLLTGTHCSHKEKSFSYKNVKAIFEFLIQTFIEYQLPKNKEVTKEHFEEGKFDKFLKASLIREDPKKKIMYEKDGSKLTIDKLELVKFLQTLTGLEAYLKMYFKLKFFGMEMTLLMSTIPICFEISEILTTDQYLFLCLAIPHIRDQKMAFKFYDTRTDGFYLPNAIFSFMGFEGPIAFFIKHIDEETNKEMILGAYVNSNVKESYKDHCCGDEKTTLFTLDSKIQFYKVSGNLDKILYISSIRFQHAEKDPGIGFGYRNDQHKLWIDSHDVQHKSYFMKFDDVFEDGTPFDEAIKYLNVKSIYLI